MIPEQQQTALRDYIGQKHREWAAGAPGPTWSSSWDAAVLATDLAADARFAQLALCGFWYGPNTEEVRSILLPVLGATTFGPPIDLVAAAISLACDQHRSQMQQRAAVAGFAAAAAGFVLWLFGRGQS